MCCPLPLPLPVCAEGTTPTATGMAPRSNGGGRDLEVSARSVRSLPFFLFFDSQLPAIVGGGVAWGQTRTRHEPTTEN